MSEATTGDATGVTGPLAGVKVLDLSRWFAGPLATSWLGDMGAEVIKIEQPGEGDPTRGVDHVFPGGISSYFLGLNRSKRSVTLNLSDPKGIEVIKRLVRESDVLVENFRPGVMDRLGLGYEELQKENERLIYCSISSFGSGGPLAFKPGMDIIVQAMGGVMGLTGPVDGPPIRVGAPVADYVGALQATTSVALALVERARSGLGQKVEAVLMEGQMGMLSNYLPGFFVTGEPSGPVGDYHPQIAPYQPYDTADGRVIIACLTEGFWRSLCGALDLGDLTTDPKFARNADRVKNRDELNAILSPLFRNWTSEDLMAALDTADVPCAPIMTISDLAEHPQVALNGSIVDLEHPRAGAYKIAVTPFRLNRTPGGVSATAPELGADTADVLTELGFSAEEIADVVSTADKT